MRTLPAVFNVSILSLAGIALVSILLVWRRWRSKVDRTSLPFRKDHKSVEVFKDAYNTIEPLNDFHWASTPVPQNAVFKPKYHLTMALENSTLSDLIAIDKTYLERVQLRRDIMSQNLPNVIQCNAPAAAAVFELYEWLFGTYLPKRFPSMYTIVTSKRQLHNQASDEMISLDAPASAESALQIMCSHIDTDFLILLPSSQAVDGSPLYHLEAFVTCCPSGFNLCEKLGLPLSGIHKPVPGYKERLERSMDRTFARLELGKLIRRSNWTITTNDQLFNLGGTHIRFDEHHDASTAAAVGLDADAAAASRKQAAMERMAAEIAAQQREVDVEHCRLRSERQTLFRLPRSRAIVFSFKTYLYPLAEIKAQGNAEALAEAIEGLGRGNVPEFTYYKKGVVWGPKVLQYLRS